MAQTKDGALKIAAARAGTTVAEYERRTAAGEKRCSGCKRWHAQSAFKRDASRHDGLTASCSEYKNRLARERHDPKPKQVFAGRSFTPARDGDAKQARRRINFFVESGMIPSPNEMPCVDCGHIWGEGERRHEYDHYRGYAAEHHETVEAVCSKCHHERERRRRNGDQY